MPPNKRQPDFSKSRSLVVFLKRVIIYRLHYFTQKFKMAWYPIRTPCHFKNYMLNIVSFNFELNITIHENVVNKFEQYSLRKTQIFE